MDELREYTGDRSPIRIAPRDDAEQLSDLVRGDSVTILEPGTSGWLHCHVSGIDVIGYVQDDGKFASQSTAFTHAIKLPFAFLYSEPKQLAVTYRRVPMNGRLALTGAAAPLLYPGGREGMKAYQLTTGEWIVSAAVAPIGEPCGDPDIVARRFLETPYLHGGRTFWGLDECGLVQTVLARCGLTLPHDVRSRLGNGLSPVAEDALQPEQSYLFAVGDIVGLHTKSRSFLLSSQRYMRVVEATEDQIRHNTKSDLLLYRIPRP